MLSNISKFMAFLTIAVGLVAHAENQKPNVLFIAVDDLRPSLGVYGDPLAITPNIDALAKTGTSFMNAFASVPTCGASRSSLMTGIRPTAERFTRYNSFAETEAPLAITIPKHLSDHGYHTVSLGKIFHSTNDSKDAWSESPWKPKVGNYHDPKNVQIAKENNGRSYPYENFEYSDLAHKDGQTATEAIRQLNKLSQNDKPFFLAVGFAKPHLPFSAPKKYWDMYPQESIALPYNHFRTKDAPKQAFHNLGELRTYYGVPKKGYISDEMALTLKRGYYASVSLIDAQIGRIRTELDKLNLTKNTIVVLWGDHGWQLGEHKLWHKHSNFRMALRAPLIFSVPGKNINQSTTAMSEFVDIYPTLMDLLDLPKPIQLQGESLAHLLDRPDDHKDTVAFSQWRQGTTMFTEKYAYTEWFDKDGNRTANMLFDHTSDIDENINIAALPEHADLVQELSQRLNKKRLSIK